MSITPLLGWRDYLHIRPDKVRGDADYYLSRAQEIRNTITIVLQGGLSLGAEQALTDLAEEDSVDFCIMVDLADGIDIPGVQPLEDDEAAKLLHFLQQEPWRSLVVDTEIAVCLAMLRSYGESEAETIWYMGDPHMLKSISRAFDGIDKEQLARFVAEINALESNPNVRFDNELRALVMACSDNAAHRLGIRPPVVFN